MQFSISNNPNNDKETQEITNSAKQNVGRDDSYTGQQLNNYGDHSHQNFQSMNNSQHPYVQGNQPRAPQHNTDYGLANLAQNFSAIDLTGQSQYQPLPRDNANGNDRNISGAQLQNAIINANPHADPQMPGTARQNSSWKNQNDDDRYRLPKPLRQEDSSRRVADRQPAARQTFDPAAGQNTTTQHQINFDRVNQNMDQQLGGQQQQYPPPNFDATYHRDPQLPNYQQYGINPQRAQHPPEPIGQRPMYQQDQQMNDQQYQAQAIFQPDQATLLTDALIALTGVMKPNSMRKDPFLTFYGTPNTITIHDWLRRIE